MKKLTSSWYEHKGALFEVFLSEEAPDFIYAIRYGGSVRFTHCPIEDIEEHLLGWL